MTSFIRSIPTSKNTSLKVSLGISVSLLFVVVLILLIHCIRKLRELPKRREKHEIAKLEKKLDKHSRSFGLTTRKFTVLELWLATGGFGESNVIAEEGTHGKVYKGILQDKSVVAIKKFESDASTRKELFFNEASILSLINHRHVVRLLGYCTDWKEEALVYEYINNGTLYKHIHENDGASSPLAFQLRMKIAVQIAAALGYLHSSTSKPSILHQNVDSKRILLEEDHTARLASFRWARLITDGQSSRIKSIVQKSSKFFNSEGIQSNLFIDKKVDDVYRFGVLLVELLTSKSQEAFSAEMPAEDKDLASFFLRYMKRDSLDKILDPQIIKKENVKTAKQVAVLAESCLRPRKDDRPSMEEVAIELGTASYDKESSAAMANLSPSPAMANFSPSPKETDHLLGSSPEMANFSPSLQ